MAFPPKDDDENLFKKPSRKSAKKKTRRAPPLPQTPALGLAQPPGGSNASFGGQPGSDEDEGLE